jgi:hypothetical protein
VCADSLMADADKVAQEEVRVEEAEEELEIFGNKLLTVKKPNTEPTKALCNWGSFGKGVGHREPISWRESMRRGSEKSTE